LSAIIYFSLLLTPPPVYLPHAARCAYGCPALVTPRYRTADAARLLMILRHFARPFADAFYALRLMRDSIRYADDA